MLSFWDIDDRTEKLKELWLSGMPAKRIAAELGAATKNQVLGKAFRLGLSHKGPKQSTAGIPKKRIRIDRGGAGMRPLKSPPRPPRTPEQVTDDNARSLALQPTVFGIENFEPHHCGYVHGEPAQQARCGRQRVEGLPYCRDHQTLCTAPPQVARPYPNMRAAFGARRDVQQVRTFLEFIDA
jgi:hypothetical protein